MIRTVIEPETRTRVNTKLPAQALVQRSVIVVSCGLECWITRQREHALDPT